MQMTFRWYGEGKRPYEISFPGWEPERMAKLDELFKAYASVTKEKLWENLKYFLDELC